MPSFTYSACSDSGKIQNGKMNASNVGDLENKLAKDGLSVLYSKRVVEGKKSSLFGKVTAKDLIMLCVHMEQLERAGVPLLDSLADAVETIENSTFKPVMASVYEAVIGGTLLSEALKERSDIFDEIFVGLIAVGEQTGRLDEAFSNLQHHLKWNDSIVSRLKKAMRYPIVLS